MGAKTINYTDAVTNIFILLGFECDIVFIVMNNDRDIFFSQPLWHMYSKKKLQVLPFYCFA